MNCFKDEFSFEKRLEESNKVLNKYLNRIPCIVEKCQKCSKINMIDKKKFLVPKDLTMGQFIYVIRKRLKISPQEAIFIFVNNTIPPSSSTISHIYNTQKDPDGFLYFQYSSENTFG